MCKTGKKNLIHKGFRNLIRGKERINRGFRNLIRGKESLCSSRVSKWVNNKIKDKVSIIFQHFNHKAI